MARYVETFSCTTCPFECSLSVTADRDGSGEPCVLSVTGNRCARGEAFARQEIVRTAAPIPRDLSVEAMRALRSVVVDAPIRMGDTVLADVLGTGVDVIASMDIDRA